MRAAPFCLLFATVTGLLGMMIRRRAKHAKITLIVVRLNIGLCLFGIAAIISAILA
jgi:hypothetical protein